MQPKPTREGVAASGQPWARDHQGYPEDFSNHPDYPISEGFMPESEVETVLLRQRDEALAKLAAVQSENRRLRQELRLPGPTPPEGYFDV